MDDDKDLDNLDRDREAEAAAEQQEEEETSFTNDRRPGDESILIIDGSNPVFTRPDADTSTSERPEGSVPNARRDAGVMRRYIIHDKKQFLKDGLGITVNKGDGPSSTTLYDELRTTAGKDGKIDDVVEDFLTNTEITNNELRELRGILNVKGSSGEYKLEALKVESEHWKKEAEKEGDTPKGKLYEAIARVADLKADEIRLRLNQKPESEEVTNMVEEEAKANDLTRFERFKKWARENLLELSAVSISIAGILTTVIVAGRNTLKRGAKSVSKFGKVVVNLAKKFGPVLSALGTLISKVLTLGALGILFLARNLWILDLALTYFIYNEHIRNRGHVLKK